MTMTYTLRSAGIWTEERGTNLLDTGAHFYEVYETADGGYFAVGAIEPQFYAELLQLLGLGDEDLSAQMDRAHVARHEGAVRRHLRHPDPGRVGGASSPGPTPARPRCCRPARRPTTPTTWPGRPSPRWPAWSSRRPSPRFLATPGEIRSAAAPPRPPTPTRRWPTGG